MMGISFQVGWNCDFRCAHCCQIHKSDALDYESCVNLCFGLFERGALRNIALTGGEVFLYEEFIDGFFDGAHSLGVPIGVCTNGSLVKRRGDFKDYLISLNEKNLKYCSVSYDYFHSRFIEQSSIVTFIRALEEVGVHTTVYVSDGIDPSREFNDYFLSNLRDVFPNVVVKRRLVSPVLLGKDASQKCLYLKWSDIDLVCPTDKKITVWPNGDIFPCCTASTSDELRIGNIWRDDVDSILESYRTHRLWSIVRRDGLGGVFYRLPCEYKMKISSSYYADTCHLCRDLCSISKNMSNYDDVLSSIFLMSKSFIHGSLKKGSIY